MHTHPPTHLAADAIRDQPPWEAGAKLGSAEDGGQQPCGLADCLLGGELALPVSHHVDRNDKRHRGEDSLHAPRDMYQGAHVSSGGGGGAVAASYARSHHMQA